MDELTAAQAHQRRVISDGILVNKDRIYEALTCTAQDCLNFAVACNIMQAADWDVADFLRAYHKGELDG